MIDYKLRVFLSELNLLSIFLLLIILIIMVSTLLMLYFLLSRIRINYNIIWSELPSNTNLFEI